MFGIYSWFYIYLYLIFPTQVAFVSSTLKDAVLAETQVLPVDTFVFLLDVGSPNFSYSWQVNLPPPLTYPPQK